MIDQYEKTVCIHSNICGGCSFQNIPYIEQLETKKNRVIKLLAQKGLTEYKFKGIIPSPNKVNYRNKMEFSFGYFQGEKTLQLGLHPKKDPQNVVTVDKCQIVDEDFNLILKTVLNYFKKQGLTPYNVMTKKGYLRHLVVRKGINTGEILVNLVTTSQLKHNFMELTDKLKSLTKEGKLVGFLHTINNNYSDIVNCDKLITIWGRNYFFEEIMGLKFKIKPFSFFQVNTRAAEKLYKTITNFIVKSEDNIVYDLYCGTGTISQIISPQVKRVNGIEIDQDAVITARENTLLNNISNCSFICGDVGSKINSIQESADTVIVNPPRSGLGTKVINHLKRIKAPQLIYSSCNPETLAPDLHRLTDNLYHLKEVKCIDMFPHTPHIETCTHLVL